MKKPIVGMGGKIIRYKESPDAAATASLQPDAPAPMEADAPPDYHAIARACGIDEHSIANYQYLIERFGAAVRRHVLESEGRRGLPDSVTINGVVYRPER